LYDLFLVNPFITLLKLLFTFGPIVKLNTVLFDDIPPCSLTYPSDVPLFNCSTMKWNVTSAVPVISVPKLFKYFLVTVKLLSSSVFVIVTLSFVVPITSLFSFVSFV